MTYFQHFKEPNKIHTFTGNKATRTIISLCFGPELYHSQLCFSHQKLEMAILYDPNIE